MTVTLHRSDISAEDGTPVITAVFGTAVSDGNAYLDLHSKDDISFEANDTYTISFSGKYLNKISTVTKYAG